VPSASGKTSPFKSQKSDTPAFQPPKFVLPWFDELCAVEEVIHLLHQRRLNIPMLNMVSSDLAKSLASGSQWSIAADADLISWASQLAQSQGLKYVFSF
jgi:hypothetical protein